MGQKTQKVCCVISGSGDIVAIGPPKRKRQHLFDEISANAVKEGAFICCLDSRYLIDSRATD